MDRDLKPHSMRNSIEAVTRRIHRLQTRTRWKSPVRFGLSAGVPLGAGYRPSASVTVPPTPASLAVTVDPGSMSAVMTMRIEAIADSPPVVAEMLFELFAGSASTTQTIRFEILDFGVSMATTLALNFTLAAQGPVTARGSIIQVDPGGALELQTAQMSYVDLMVFAR